MSFRTQKEDDECVVFGFIRIIQETLLYKNNPLFNIPESIKFLCFKYLCM